MMLEPREKAGPRARVSDQTARAFHHVLHDVFGVPFALFDAATGLPVPGDALAAGCDVAAATVLEWAATGQPVVIDLARAAHGPGIDLARAAHGPGIDLARAAHGPGIDLARAAHGLGVGNAFRIVLVLHAGGKPVLVGVGVAPALCETAAARAVEHARLQAWARDFSERLRLRDELSVRAKADDEMRTQLQLAWKVNLALGDCAHRLRFNRHKVRDHQRILQSALQLLNAQSLLWVPVMPGGELARSENGLGAPVTAGYVHLSAAGVRDLAHHLSRNPAALGPDPYLCNDPRNTSWGASWPAIDSLLAFHVQRQGFSAWLIALNKMGKGGARSAGAPSPAPFRTSDAALLSPFVNMLDMHCRAAGKFDEIRSLLVGLARSMTAAIDAKDAYTAGHSERVARLAVEIGQELGLPDEQLSDAYLAGLLHDVGKIGIREAVLCKPGKFTAEEYDHIKQHVTIGYHILQDLDPIRHLLPGVLYHHERFDGKGYPDGLAGEKIPALPRLLAVADGFDAMNSNRPYRPALPHAQLFAELTRGAGTHWDPEIVAAALRCKDRLVAISQRGLGDSLGHAVDAALRTGESSLIDRLTTSAPREPGAFG
jgi:HD-GYP domain-containing protein (c-di-GMP phosphodiesterase class II)